MPSAITVLTPLPASGAEITAAPAPGPLPIALLGIPFDPLTIADTIGRVREMIASRRPHFLVTANVDFLVKARRDKDLRQAMFLADHVLCDGTPLVWASRWLGNALPGRTAGSDLAPALVSEAAARGWKLFFLGAAPGVAEAAARRLQEQHPTLPPIEHHSPPYRPLKDMDHEDIAARIRAAAPDILLVAFGCPKQEKWIAMHYRTLGVPVCIGVGGTLDFLAGRISRAPVWMRRTGTEWFYRLAQEPRRLFQRYVDDLLHFFPQLWRQWWALALSAPSSPSDPTSEITAYGLRVGVGEELHLASLRHTFLFWMRATEQKGHCLIDLSNVRSIDSTGIAFLACWQKRLAAVRRNLVLYRPSEPVRRALQKLQVADQFVIAEGS